MIHVRLNGQPLAESPGDPARSKTGPIGLQLHDRFTWIMFRKYVAGVEAGTVNTWTSIGSAGTP
jgi:hypothetical protein